MRRLSLLIVAVLLSTATSSLHNVQKEGESANHRVKVYKLYHDWKGDNSFTERGMIILEVASDATRNESTARTKLGQATALPGLAAKVTNIDNCINVRAMDDLVQIGGMYRIKAVDEGGNTALASVPACSVRRANFREHLNIVVGASGEVLSLFYKPLVSPLAPPCSSIEPLSGSGMSVPIFKSRVLVDGAQKGHTTPLVLPNSRPPPGLVFFPNKNQNEINSDAVKDKAQGKSFLLRYWYIIVPACVVLLFRGEEPPPPRSSGSGRQSNLPAASVVETSKTTTTTAGVAPNKGSTQRRGKRE